MKFVSVRSSYGNLSLFELVQGLQYDFPENFRCNLPLNERENFSDFSLHDTFESQSFRFPFSAKNSLSWGEKCEKLNVRKS